MLLQNTALGSNMIASRHATSRSARRFFTRRRSIKELDENFSIVSQIHIIIIFDLYANADNVRDHGVVRHAGRYIEERKCERLGGIGFAVLHSRADGGRERASVETAQQTTRRPSLLHADAALLRILP